MRIGLAFLSMTLAATAVGCGLLHHNSPAPPITGPAVIENPLSVPLLNEDYMWNQIVDTVDDYFKIEREDRVRVMGGVVSEGRIETFPETGSGYLEPWRRDSTRGPEKTLASLQSIRRRALVRVAPGPEGYQIFVTVLKELEDVSRPEFSTVGGSTQRHDGTIVRTSPIRGAEAVTLGWIQIGRDPSLEQQILFEIQYRLGAGQPSRPPGAHGLLHH